MVRINKTNLEISYENNDIGFTLTQLFISFNKKKYFQAQIN